MFDKVFGNMEQLKDIAVKVNEQMKDPVYVFEDLILTFL